MAMRELTPPLATSGNKRVTWIFYFGADRGVVIGSSYILSRPGYQRFLFEEAENRGVQFQFDSPADTIEDSATRPALLLKNGDRIEADLIVGADGTYIYMNLTV
jgi:2-polyprenyl-6-methoxyphenol hydroxylase-like FAD-dependent oxidoreductase